MIMTQDMLDNIALSYHRRLFIDDNKDLEAQSIYHNICQICGNVHDSRIVYGFEDCIQHEVRDIIPIGQVSEECIHCSGVYKSHPDLYLWVMKVLSTHNVLDHDELVVGSIRDIIKHEGLN